MFTKINDIDFKVLSLFTRGYSRSYYIREVEKLLLISSRSALLVLDKFEKLGILSASVRGKLKIYSIVNSVRSRDFFVLVEQYKKLKFFEHYPLFREVSVKIEEFFSGSFFIFGNYTKKSSVLNIFCVGKYDDEKIIKVAKKYSVVVNIKSCTKNFFENNMHKDALMEEVLDDHIVISGIEYFTGCVLDWTI